MSGELVNKRVRALAAEHDLTVPETLAALDQHPLEVDRDAYLRRTIAMELVDLDQVTSVFRAKALAGDVAAGALLVNIAERRATLLGLNAPIGHAVRIVQHEAAAAPTGTQKIRAALDNVLGITPRERERELEDKTDYGDTPLTPDERAELDRLPAARARSLPAPGDPGNLTPRGGVIS